MKNNPRDLRPSQAFVLASWAVLLIGMVAFVSGLWRSTLQLNEKGYYFTVLMYGLFSAVSLQKTVRDRMDGTPVTDIYFGLCWASVVLCLLLLTSGLWNAGMTSSEKGFYAMCFVLSMYSAVTVQKNIRDKKALESEPDDRG